MKLMNANVQKILLATLAVLVFLAFLPILVMSSSQAGNPMLFGMMGYRTGYGMVGGMFWMWISALLIFGLGFFSGWAVFGKK
jgi:hypothetical protein